MAHEVTIGDSTFIVNNYSSSSAKETLAELLSHFIVKNAELELKNKPTINIEDTPKKLD